MNRKNRGLYLFLLHLAILVYSFSAVFMKYAALADFLSFRFFIFYALVLVCLAIYAIFWQQILKHFKLSFAHINRAVGMLWTVVFGVLFFKESVSITGIIGLILIITGIIVTVTANE